MKKWAFKLFTSKEKLTTPAKERGEEAQNTL
jgi:hypothetical protein